MPKRFQSSDDAPDQQTPARVSPLWPQRAPARVALPSTFLALANALGLGMPAPFSQYRLRRVREGVEVWLHADGDGVSFFRYALNVSLQSGIYPANFSAARQWVAAFGGRHGLQLEEIRRPSSRRAPAV